MKSLHNIEKSGFHAGEYVGYSDGVWRIVNVSRMWRAIHKGGKYWSIEGKTLADVSTQLETLSIVSKVSQ